MKPMKPISCKKQEVLVIQCSFCNSTFQTIPPPINNFVICPNCHTDLEIPKTYRSMITLGITGHRPPGLGCSYDIPNPVYDKICRTLKEKFLELKVQKIISGMALGVDQFSIDVALELGIPFIAAVPFDGQESKWPDSSKRKFRDLLEKAESVVVVSPGPYAPEKMHIRDRWIVDHSDALLGIWNGIQKGGTFGTIRYAQKQKDYPVHIIDPASL